MARRGLACRRAPLESLQAPFSRHFRCLPTVPPASPPPRPWHPAPQAVQLALQCLSFDFVGTCLDESSEDLGTIQVPSGACGVRLAAWGLVACGCGVRLAAWGLVAVWLRCGPTGAPSGGGGPQRGACRPVCTA